MMRYGKVWLQIGCVLLLALSVFAPSPASAGFTTLHAFDGIDVAGAHRNRLIQGTDGAFYGTTEGFGTSDDGTVFKINPDGSGFTILHSFDAHNAADGAWPEAGLIQGRNGALYGTTVSGGSHGWGTVFRINPNGSGFTILHSFTGLDLTLGCGEVRNDGQEPEAGLIQGTDGALYGTTPSAGPVCGGTVFKINPDGSGYKILYDFSGDTDGDAPEAGLIQGRNGALYGTVVEGGPGGEGAVFKINPDGSGYTQLHSFTGGPDGGAPTADLIQGKDGALYGTTSEGGSHAGFCGDGCGTVFKINPDGSGFTVLHTFTGGSTDGAWARRLIQGTDGALYGVTGGGGDNHYCGDGCGTVFRLNTDGSGFTLLYAFTGESDGSTPIGGVTQGADGALYGMTDGDEGSTVFKLDLTATPTAAVSLNGSAFRTGQTITYQAILIPGTTPTQVDMYLGVLLPGGATFISFVPGPGGTIAFAFGPVPVPFARNVTLTPTVVPFSYTFTGTEPVGTYFTYASLAVAGSDPMQAANRLSLAVQAFQFTP